ncbi:hypothetical protein ADK51_04915 [Streptomyces sp. WM6368]|nr:hypothetical protein ADK51_04915 [Streptomyces sp. WM6368]
MRAPLGSVCQHRADGLWQDVASQACAEYVPLLPGIDGAAFGQCVTCGLHQEVGEPHACHRWPGGPSSAGVVTPRQMTVQEYRRTKQPATAPMPVFAGLLQRRA